MTVFDDHSQLVIALRQQKTICTPEAAEALARAGERRVFSEGDLIAKQGNLGDELFYILSGAVRVVINQHDYCRRERNELVGEMAIIEPGAGRSADLIAAIDSTTLLAVRATDFRRVAEEHNDIWECVSRELACRLRQRDAYFIPPNQEPVVFIASSTEGANVLAKAESSLTKTGRQLRVWNKRGIFRPTRGTLEELERHAREVDFAVIIVTPDDIRESRGAVKFVPRDNVMIEFGLFMGALGRDRAYLLVEGDKDLALASDLHGVTVLYFQDDDELNEKIEEVDAQVEGMGRLYRFKKAISP